VQRTNDGNETRSLRRRRATLSDVARLAGVDTSTVSRTLRDDPSQVVRIETRERILAAARQLGYRPNSLARGLRTQRTNAIGLLVPDLDNVGFTDITRGVQEAASEHGYLLLIAEAHDPESTERLFTRLGLEGQVDGLLIAFASLHDDAIPRWVGGDVPIVMVNRRAQSPAAEPNLGSVVVDDERASEIAVAHLVDSGHRRIGHITGSRATDTGVRRERGFLEALGDHGLQLDPRWLLEGDYTQRGGYEATRLLLQQPEDRRPTALYVGNLMSTLGALDALQEAGVRVPDEMSLITIDEHLVAAHTRPPLTTVRMPLGRMGREAVEMLLSILSGNPAQPHMVDERPVLVPRGSVARLS
jgi:DNA-binding LacI/PurR family transcriptional regulator